jgi:hypothetical protein
LLKTFWYNVNFPFLDSDVSRTTPYWVFIPERVRFSRVCINVKDVNKPPSLHNRIAFKIPQIKENAFAGFIADIKRWNGLFFNFLEYFTESLHKKIQLNLRSFLGRNVTIKSFIKADELHQWNENLIMFVNKKIHLQFKITIATTWRYFSSILYQDIIYKLKKIKGNIYLSITST